MSYVAFLCQLFYCRPIRLPFTFTARHLFGQRNQWIFGEPLPRLRNFNMHLGEIWPTLGVLFVSICQRMWATNAWKFEEKQSVWAGDCPHPVQFSFNYSGGGCEFWLALDSRKKNYPEIKTSPEDHLQKIRVRVGWMRRKKVNSSCEANKKCKYLVREMDNWELGPKQRRYLSRTAN